MMVVYELLLQDIGWDLKQLMHACKAFLYMYGHMCPFYHAEATPQECCSGYVARLGFGKAKRRK